MQAVPGGVPNEAVPAIGDPTWGPTRWRIIGGIRGGGRGFRAKTAAALSPSFRLIFTRNVSFFWSVVSISIAQKSDIASLPKIFFA